MADPLISRKTGESVTYITKFVNQKTPFIRAFFDVTSYYPIFCSVQALIDQDAHLTSESERFVVPSAIRQLTEADLVAESSPMSLARHRTFLSSDHRLRNYILETFHEQLPLPVPCYDLVLVTELTLGCTSAYFGYSRLP